MTPPLPPLTADSRFVDDLVPSPNVDTRAQGCQPCILVLHYTGLPTFERSIEVLSDPLCKVSCHYVVDLDGRTVQMVPEAVRAWHAGVSSWRGQTDLNSLSVGIEIQNVGHDAGYPDFPEAQMRAVERLAADIVARHAIATGNVVAHSDIAPSRKIDPGEKFDWQRLSRAGIGEWIEPVPMDETDPGLGPGTSGAEVAAMQRALADYGYGVTPNGELDASTVKVVEAFQRRFRPARIDGRIDRSTRQTLDRLLQYARR